MKAFLPGTDEQVSYLYKNLDLTDKMICVFGSNSEFAAVDISKRTGKLVELIVEDHDSFINSKLLLKGDKNVNLRIMAFDNSDFTNDSFNLVYAQASISNQNRTRVVKEIKRILKPEGYLCVGEIVSFLKDAPRFIKDIWLNSGITPLQSSEILKYYEEKNFKVISEVDLDSSLEDFYSMSHKKLIDIKNSISEEEKSYYKKLLARISHESNAFLKLGGNKYMGFKVLLLQKI